MGKITHADIGTQLTKTEWEANTTHLDSQGNILEVSRSAILVVAASDASAKSKAGADYVCDGTADDVEIQAALDALPSVGGTVVLSEGTFTLAATVTFNSFRTLIGAGLRATKITSASDITLLKILNNTYSTTIGRLWLYGYAKGVANVSMGIEFGATTDKIYWTRLYDLFIENCRKGISIKSAYKPQTFSSLHLENNYDGIVFEDGTYTSELMLSDSRILYCDNIGIYIYRKASGVQLNNIEISSCVTGIRVEDLYWAHFNQVLCDSNQRNYWLEVSTLIKGVQFSNCWAGAATYEHMKITGCSKILLSNMQIRPGGSKGIAVSGSNEITITGGQISELSSYGIDLANCNDCVVVGIRVTGCDTGLVESGTSNYNTIVGNNFRGNTNPIVIVGVNTINQHNQ